MPLHFQNLFIIIFLLPFFFLRKIILFLEHFWNKVYLDKIGCWQIQNPNIHSYKNQWKWNLKYYNNFLVSKHYLSSSLNSCSATISPKTSKNHTVLHQLSQTSKVRRKEIYYFCLLFLKKIFEWVTPSFMLLSFFKIMLLVLKYDFWIVSDFYFYTHDHMMWFNGYGLRLEELVPWGFKWAGDCVLLDGVDVNCSFILTIHCCCIPC